jgi:hypothetical protein
MEKETALAGYFLALDRDIDEGGVLAVDIDLPL